MVPPGVGGLGCRVVAVTPPCLAEPSRWRCTTGTVTAGEPGGVVALGTPLPPRPAVTPPHPAATTSSGSSPPATGSWRGDRASSTSTR